MKTINKIKLISLAVLLGVSTVLVSCAATQKFKRVQKAA